MAKTTRRPALRQLQIAQTERRAIGSRLLGLRRERAWTQRALAERSAIAHRRISRFENGWVAPNLPEALRLAEALGCSLDFLLRGVASDGDNPAAVLTRPVAEIAALGTTEQCAVLGELLEKLLLGFRLSREERP